MGANLQGCLSWCGTVEGDKRPRALVSPPPPPGVGGGTATPGLEQTPEASPKRRRTSDLERALSGTFICDPDADDDECRSMYSCDSFTLASQLNDMNEPEFHHSFATAPDGYGETDGPADLTVFTPLSPGTAPRSQQLDPGPHFVPHFGRDGAPQDHIYKKWELASEDLARLANGDTFFNIVCRRGGNLSYEERHLLQRGFNLSGFINESAENGVDPLDMDSQDCLGRHTFILTRAMYLLPDVRLDDLPLDLLASPDYHEKCQPGKPTIWRDCTEPNTFRITKNVIPRLFSMCIQFQCSEVPKEELYQLQDFCGGLRPHRAVLMERTKRSKGKVDMTRQCKSILCYHELASGAGIIVVNPTCVANTSLPRGIEWAMDTFGPRGVKEVSETAERTRRFLAERSTPPHPPLATSHGAR